MNQVELIGTDGSTGTYSSPVMLTQVDNKFKASENSDLNLNVDASVNLRSALEKNPEKASFRGLNRNSSPVIRPMSLDQCKSMVRQIFSQQVHDAKLRNAEIMRKSSGGNPRLADFLQRASEFVLRNTTVMDTRYAVGPGGNGIYVGHSSRGNSTNSANRNLMDNQSHGNYKESKTTLLNFNVLAELTLGGRKRMNPQF